MNGVKERIISLLLSTEREGMENLIKWMEENGFFTSPCSGSYHLSKIGGLAEHSNNVLDQAMKLASSIAPDISDDSMIICSLLHDLGKCGDHGKPGYVPNMVKDGRPTKAEPEQKYKQSELKPYEANKELYPIDHEIRSIKIVSKFINLTEDEELAILWHNGLYGNFRYQIQGKETPLYMILHFADMWASRVIEREEDGSKIQKT